jgi:multicomponent K+:H+ antiporter subunit G
MNQFAEIPLWVALLVAFFLVLGSVLTLLGAIGLVRFETFYQRVHAPTLGTTWGVGAILIASMIFFSATQSGLVSFRTGQGCDSPWTSPRSMASEAAFEPV